MTRRSKPVFRRQFHALLGQGPHDGTGQRQCSRYRAADSGPRRICGVSVGSLHHHFDLAAATEESVWQEIFHAPEGRYPVLRPLYVRLKTLPQSIPCWRWPAEYFTRNSPNGIYRENRPLRSPHPLFPHKDGSVPPAVPAGEALCLCWEEAGRILAVYGPVGCLWSQGDPGPAPCPPLTASAPA